MIGRMLGAARLNVETYEDVESDGGATIQALLIVILVTIASFVGRLLSGGDDLNVVTALIEGLVLGIAGWAIWALVTWMGWGNDTEDGADRSGLGAAGARLGIRADPETPVRVCLRTVCRRDHRSGGVHLVVRMYDSCRTAVLGLHVHVASVLRDPDILHPRCISLYHRCSSSLPNNGQRQ